MSLIIFALSCFSIEENFEVTENLSFKFTMSGMMLMEIFNFIVTMSLVGITGVSGIRNRTKVLKSKQTVT